MTYQPFTGGGIPVHAETIVSVFYSDDSFDRNLAAGNINWSREGDGPHVVAYDVIEEYVEPVEPREWWINCEDGVDRLVLLHHSHSEADRGRRNSAGEIVNPGKRIIHVREVME